jgi:hypothetical protein
MTKEEVLALLEKCQSRKDWGMACDFIKMSCDGYPDFWWEEVIQSGVGDRIAARWGSDMRIRVVEYPVPSPEKGDA